MKGGGLDRLVEIDLFLFKLFRMEKKDIICWWSGGITSAVACKKAIELFGKDNCRVIMIDTKNEDEDTYRFRVDCEFWYQLPIETITALGNGKYNTIQDVWEDFESLNVATGAICSTELKRRVRKDWQKNNEYKDQVFGFEFDKKEMNRALAMREHYPESNPIFPLLMLGLSKKDCINIVQEAGITVPRSYTWGFGNNNCLKTGCVQGGIGYWQKMRDEFPDKFEAMAEEEHKLTNLRGEPVTMLKDQSNKAKLKAKEDKKSQLVFLVKHPDYPDNKCLNDMPLRTVKPLTECNGFCNIDIYNKKNETLQELNFENI